MARKYIICMFQVMHLMPSYLQQHSIIAGLQPHIERAAWLDAQTGLAQTFSMLLQLAIVHMQVQAKLANLLQQQFPMTIKEEAHSGDEDTEHPSPCKLPADMCSECISWLQGVGPRCVNALQHDTRPSGQQLHLFAIGRCADHFHL